MVWLVALEWLVTLKCGTGSSERVPRCGPGQI